MSDEQLKEAEKGLQEKIDEFENAIKQIESIVPSIQKLADGEQGEAIALLKIVIATTYLMGWQAVGTENENIDGLVIGTQSFISKINDAVEKGGVKLQMEPEEDEG